MRQTQDTQKRSNLKSFIIIGLLLLLVAVIGFGGYTLSKYLTSKEEQGTANVAKWGFTVSANAENLFGKNYKYGTDNSVVTTDDTGLTVKAANNAVAPGTTGSMTFSIKGSAEVKAKINLELTVTSDVALKYTKDGTTGEYYPVKWTLKKNNQVVEGAENVTLEAIKAMLDAETTYEAGANEINDEYELSWAWDFDANGAGTNDALDTLLGMYSENTTNATNGDYTVVVDGTSTTISFALTISVTQIAE